MGLLKFAIVFMAIFACAFAVNTEWGYRNPTDSLIFNTRVLTQSVLNSFVQTEVLFPLRGQTNTRTITAIQIIDFSNNSGNIATVWSGGVNTRAVTLYIRSQYNQPINATVYIYGN